MSRPSLGRALRILQALITEAERRGYGVHLDDKAGDPRVCITVKGHESAVSVREKDGVLRVVLPSEHSGRRLWSDGIRAAVEDKLGDALANIEARAEEAEQRRLEWERREEERRRAWEQAMERARVRFAEDQRAAFLRDQVTAWRLAADIRGWRLPLALPSERIVARARCLAYEGVEGAYNLFGNNCETVALWCVSGFGESLQRQTLNKWKLWVDAGLAIGLAAASRRGTIRPRWLWIAGAATTISLAETVMYLTNNRRFYLNARPCSGV